MLHFHATKKLLNTSRVDSLLYVHEPSLLTVVIKGKTIASTIDNFRLQLKHLLLRYKFPAAFIEKEMSFADDYVIGKTNSKSMLAHINQMILQVTYYNTRYASYPEIDTITHEDIFMDWLYKSKGQKNFQTPLDYWKKVLDNYPS
jgi:hypothetical protein